jgi:hypothetical protein
VSGCSCRTWWPLAWWPLGINLAGREGSGGFQEVNQWRRIMHPKLAISAALAGISISAAAALAMSTGVAGAAQARLNSGDAAKAAVKLPTITLTLTGKKVTVAGTLQSGGVQIVSKVSGEAQAAPVLVRLDPGVTVPQFLAAVPKIAADPNNIAGIGAIVFSPQANKGISSAQANLAPGQYVAVDIAPSGPPPLTTFVITKSDAPAALPKPGATIASIEFAFQGPARLHDGELVRFANDGFLVHMIVAARARSAAGAREIARLLKAGKDGQAQHLATDFYAFDNLLSHGAYQQLVIHNRPGLWVLACFMDTQDHREHTQLGMERIIQIVK